MQVSFINSIDAITSAEWNAIAGTDYPFTRHEFLQALEDSGATTRNSGWQAHHLLIHNDSGELIALMPLYLKYHSYGEYIFDWAWADAYQRHNIAYYPKLLSAIPYTPATGPRLCFEQNSNQEAITQFAMAAVINEAKEKNISSVHVLFSEQSQNQQLQQLGLNTRLSSQFHWFNKDYQDFNDFLADFSSRKRKNLNKERRAIEQQNLRLELIEGPDISADVWEKFYYFYQLTYAKRSGHGGYLEQAFFEQIAKTMAEHLVLVLAYDENNQMIAGALNFRSSDTLYGRYWGCTEEKEFLHFEACYYQGIEYCIANGLKRFDPGAQGEHKIQRGFTPITTYSNHWILDPKFSQAINDFLQQDNNHTKEYIKQVSELLPFKKL